MRPSPASRRRKLSARSPRERKLIRAAYLKGRRTGIRYEKQNGLASFSAPNTFAILLEEKGRWIPFQKGTYPQVHGLMLENSFIWDSINGWRNRQYEPDRVKDVKEAWEIRRKQSR